MRRILVWNYPLHITKAAIGMTLLGRHKKVATSLALNFIIHFIINVASVYNIYDSPSCS
jgi:hypothetical protein